MAYPGKFRLVLTGDDLNTIAGALHEEWCRNDGKNRAYADALFRLCAQFDEMLEASTADTEAAGWPVMVGGVQ